jgi:hypothetical protein
VNENESTQEEAENAPDQERDPAGDVEPRGNPEPDQDAVEQGQEQLDKVSGN